MSFCEKSERNTKALRPDRGTSPTRETHKCLRDLSHLRRRETSPALARAAGEQAVERYLESRVGASERVLVEKPGLGRTEGFAPVRTDPTLGEGVIAARTITGVAGQHLTTD